MIAFVLGWFGITFGSMAALDYVAELGRQLWRVLEWVLRCEAYMIFRVRRGPSSRPRRAIGRAA